jgi:hypothetical protein
MGGADNIPSHFRGDAMQISQRSANGSLPLPQREGTVFQRLALICVLALVAVAIGLGAAPPAAAAMNVQEVTSPGGVKAWLIEITACR